MHDYYDIFKLFIIFVFIKELRNCFMEKTISFLIMNELYMSQKYADCVHVFDVYTQNIHDLTDVGYNLKKYLSKGLDQGDVSPAHLRLVCMSLLLLNTREAFKRMQRLLLVEMHQFDFAMCFKSFACCFLLAIQQVVPLFYSFLCCFIFSKKCFSYLCIGEKTRMSQHSLSPWSWSTWESKTTQLLFWIYV